MPTQGKGPGKLTSIAQSTFLVMRAGLLAHGAGAGARCEGRLGELFLPSAISGTAETAVRPLSPNSLKMFLEMCVKASKAFEMQRFVYLVSTK